MPEEGSQYVAGEGNPGPATDRWNEPVVDPTKNVLDLVSAAIQRQDDLRGMESKHIRELLKLSGEGRKRDIEWASRMSDLRAVHAKEVLQAEAARLDAIREVDQNQVQRAAEVQATQATTLAAQVATSAETLRTQVAAAAEAATLGLGRALEPIVKDIADLRRAQYEAQGQKAQVVETHAGQANYGMWIGVGLTVFGLLISVAAIIVVIVLAKA